MWEKEALRRLTQPIMAEVAQCSKCKRYRKSIEQRTVTCEAYPNGIPKDILTNKVDHFKVNYPGDNGLLGEPK